MRSHQSENGVVTRRGGFEGDTHAHDSLVSRSSNVAYGGRSIRLKHVWLDGRLVGAPDFSIVNRLGPSDPWRSLKPLTGMREVPVLNWRSRAFFSAGQAVTHFQNQPTISSLGL